MFKTLARALRYTSLRHGAGRRSRVNSSHSSNHSFPPSTLLHLAPFHLTPHNLYDVGLAPIIVVTVTTPADAVFVGAAKAEKKCVDVLITIPSPLGKAEKVIGPTIVAEPYGMSMPQPSLSSMTSPASALSNAVTVLPVLPTMVAPLSNAPLVGAGAKVTVSVQLIVPVIVVTLEVVVVAACCFADAAARIAEACAYGLCAKSTTELPNPGVIADLKWQTPAFGRQ